MLILNINNQTLTLVTGIWEYKLNKSTNDKNILEMRN